MSATYDEETEKAIQFLKELSRAIDSDPEAIAAMSIEEVRSELEAMGADVDGFHAGIARELGIGELPDALVLEDFRLHSSSENGLDMGGAGHCWFELVWVLDPSRRLRIAVNREEREAVMTQTLHGQPARLRVKWTEQEETDLGGFDADGSLTLAPDAVERIAQFFDLRFDRQKPGLTRELDIGLSWLRERILDLLENAKRSHRVAFADELSSFTWPLKLPREASSFGISEAFLDVACDSSLMVRQIRVTVFSDEVRSPDIKLGCKLHHASGRELAGKQASDDEYEFVLNGNSFFLSELPDWRILVEESATMVDKSSDEEHG